MPDPGAPLQLCEWGRASVAGWQTHERQAVEAAARQWQKSNRLNAAPLTLTGASGETITARQYVGVVEAAGQAVEIYPKLDAGMIGSDSVPHGNTATSVLRNLLWMLHVSGHDRVAEADSAALEETPTHFLEVFALLLGRNLQAELRRGVPRRYEIHEGDLPGVRGRIQIGAQVSRLWNRYDKTACVWDEFTPDTPTNRLLRCACRFLAGRVRHGQAAFLLRDCLALLDDAADVDPATALREFEPVRRVPFRGSARMGRAILLARRLLRGWGHHLGAGTSDTFVFLLDMNRVFEDYARAALEAACGVPVREPEIIGTLLQTSPGGIWQKPDYRWTTKGGTVWIADAKYKHLAKNQNDSLTFAAVEAQDEDDNTPTEEMVRAGRVLSPNDIRQLTVYAELYHRRTNAPVGEPLPRLALVYPFTGTGTFAVSTVTAWNDSPLSLVPLRVAVPPGGVFADVLPPLPDV